MKLLPFDIEKAKAGAKVTPRDGCHARIICFDALGDFPIIYLKKEHDVENIVSCTISGHFYNGVEDSPNDLLIVGE